MRILSLHLEGNYFKAALLQLYRHKWEVLFAQEYKKNFSGCQLLDEQLSSFPGDFYVASALKSSELCMRETSLPLKRRRVIKKALPFQVDTLIPFVRENVTIIPEIVSQREEAKIRLYSFAEDILLTHIDEINQLGYDPDWVTAVPLALEQFALHTFPSHSYVIIVHFGWEETQYVYMKNGTFIASQSITFGWGTFIDILHQEKWDVGDFSVSTFLAALEEKKITSHLLDSFLCENTRVLGFFEKITPRHAEEKVVIGFTGYTQVIEALAKKYDYFGLECLLPENSGENTAALCDHALEIGIGWSAYVQEKRGLQLRTVTHCAQGVRRRWKKKLYTCLALGSALSLVCFCGLQLHLIKKEQHIRELFYAMQDHQSENTVLLSSLRLPRKHLQQQVQKMQSHYRNNQTHLSLLHLPQGVSDMLVRLFSGDSFLAEGDVHLENLTYELVSHPSIDCPGEPFCVKISFCCRAKERATISEFIKHIGKRVDISDLQEEEVEDAYYISFFLDQK